MPGIDLAKSVRSPGNRAVNRRLGKTWIVQPNREGCKQVGVCDLGERCETSPAFQDGRIYIRGKKHLFCIGQS